MTNKKKPISNGDKIKFVRWLMINEKALNGLTLAEIKNKAERDLKILFVESTIARTIREGELNIKYLKGATKSSSNFMRVMFARLNRIESAYMDLCKTVGVDPVDMNQPITLKDEDNG